MVRCYGPKNILLRTIRLPSLTYTIQAAKKNLPLTKRKKNNVKARHSPSYKEEDCLALHIDIQMLKWSDMDFK